MKKILGMIAICVLLIGCNDPKEVSNENFEKVINKYLIEKKESFTCKKVGRNFPLKDTFGVYEKSFRNYIDSGLMKVDIQELEKKDFLTGKIVKDFRRTYSLTKRGEKHLKDGKFCFGKPVLFNVISFTEPVIFMGKTVSEVRYSYKLKDLPKWLTSNKEKEKRLTIYLTNEGWEYK